MYLPRKVPPLLRISFLCALAFNLVIFLFFGVSSSHLSDKEPVRSYVKYISANSLSSDVELEEYATLFDSAPLFVPTLWNASQSLEVEFEDVTLDQFPQFEPQINILKDLSPQSLLRMDDFPVNEPLDLLASRFWRFFTGFGKSEYSSIVFAETPPLAEVSVLDSSDEQLLLQPVGLDASTLFSVNRPVVYHIRVFGNGLSVSAPILVQTSGSDAFDQSVAEWIRLPEVLVQLPEGYLEVRVFFW